MLLLAVPALAAQPTREDRVAATIARAADAPAALRLLLTPMPKGGDLHNHLDGSVYAEDFLQWAAQDGDCIARRDFRITPPPCIGDQVPAAQIDTVFYRQAVDALSMRDFVPGTGTGELSGHDHTFATFGRFAAVASAHLGDMLAATRRIAAADHVDYIEQITDPSAAFAPALIGLGTPFADEDFAAEDRALAPKLPAMVAAARAEYDSAETKMRATLHCGTPSAEPACAVATHYLFFVLRTLAPRQVFAQIALGFALVKADPRFVGVNLVAPEDDPIALRDFALQMRMFAFFHARDLQVKLSLHAGELVLGLVPPTALGFHIRDTIETAGATRIGHGYALPYEHDAPGLLAEMARRRIAVEINLTSNAITAGLSRAEHPLALYRAAHVPVTLSADDEGVFRIDLTHEYVRAVTEQKLSYRDLKEMARNGLEYSFLPGQSLWQSGDYRRLVPQCAAPSPACDAFLKTSERAALQMRLERELAAYEDGLVSGTAR